MHERRTAAASLRVDLVSATTPIIGTPGATIGAQCDGPDAGTEADADDVNGALESIVNDIATIKSTALCPVVGFAMSGACTVGGVLAANGGLQVNAGGFIIATGQTAIVNADVTLGDLSVLTVTNATNATPIVVTTSTSHGLYDGAQLTVASVGGNTNANGTWVVKASGHTAFQFELVGSFGNSAYTSGGTVTKQGQVAFVTTRALSRTCTCFYGTWVQPSGDYWQFDPNGTFVAHTTTTPSASGSAQYIGSDLDIPQGASLVTVTAYFKPNTGHGGAPASPANVQVLRYDLRAAPSGSNPTILGFANATYGSAGAYEVYTALVATITPELVDRTRFRYYATFQTETGANALDLTTFYGLAFAGSTLVTDQL